MNEKPLKILVMKILGLGNWLLATGAFQDIRAHYPKATIYHLTQTQFAQLAREQGCFDHVLITHWEDHFKKILLLGPIFRLSWIRKLRNINFDIVFDFDNTKKFTDLLHPQKLFTKKKTMAHEVNLYRNIIKEAGIDAQTDPCLKWQTPSSLYGSFCVLIARSKYEQYGKNWPIERFQALALLLQKINITPVIIGAKRDLAPLKPLRLMQKNIDLVGKVPLDHLPGIFSKASFVVGVDTGTTHMSAIVGARTIGLYGPTTIEAWGLVGPQVSWIKKDKMNEISVDEVWEVCQEHLPAFL